MRNTLLYIAILFSLPLQGQISFFKDTIKINEVVISHEKINPDPSGFKKVTIDSTVLKNYSHGTLADLLSENSKIFIKSYGMGGIATPSFRGTGASHTQIAWNNININQPMLGQSDLSLIPTGLIDDIQIYFGGSSMALSNGGFGGIINLETKPEWKKQTIISINPGLGSFGQYTGLVKVKTGNAHIQTVTKAFLQSSENDFRYLNTEISSEPIWQKRKYSQMSQTGFIQELYFRKEKNVASARIWYQSAERNLPSSMLSQQLNSGEKQSDESFRAMLNYDMYKHRNDYSFTAALLVNSLNYKNLVASIDSRNLSETLILKTGMESRIEDYTKLRFVMEDELSVVKTNNYDQNGNRNTTSITASAERKGYGRIGTMILVREIFTNNSFLIPDFSAGFQYRLTDEKEYFLKANISRNSKIPAMNDLFWVPGGNPDLKNEYAFIYELTYEMKQKISSPLTLRYDLSIYRNTIKDMIQWHPGEFSYWSADNIQNVNSMGLESSVILDYTINDLTCRFNAGYSFTKATNSGEKNNNAISIGKQLMYIPEHQANASLLIDYRNFYSSWIANLTGRRYITVDNSRFLEGYLINNILTGYKINMKASSIDINFNVDNLFNINYQAIAYYPLPGRSYSVKILVQFVK